MENKYEYYVYIVTNYHRTVYYVGVTNDIIQRIIEHYLNRGNKETFTGRYYLFYLLYFQKFQYVNDAIAFEKEVKGWRREKKIDLIKTFNPEMIFLNEELFGEWPPSGELIHRKDSHE